MDNLTRDELLAALESTALMVVSMERRIEQLTIERDEARRLSDIYKKLTESNAENCEALLDLWRQRDLEESVCENALPI